jgi:hypothetical protein
MMLGRAVFRLAAMMTLCAPAGVAAQGVDGYVSVMVDVLPDVQLKTGARHAVTELRARVFAERRFTVGERIRFTAAGFADGLVADRGQPSTTTAAIVRAQELHVEAAWEKADLRAGFGRIVWGRLDELQPTDVVNPLDFARFFFEGRAEARMPVGLIRGRLLPSDRFAIEAIYVPVFRRGEFDQLDEDTSPFNIAPAPSRIETPARSFANGQGGVRTTVTTGRVDWAVSVYRGFETVPVYEQTAEPEPGRPVVQRFPRFTMVGGDFETVRGEWGLRGELAAKSDVVEGGIGVDRRTGTYRIAGTVMTTRRLSSHAQGDGGDVTLITAIERSFARESRVVRVFAVYNPAEESAFARVIANFSIRDNVAVETSGGWFTGSGIDALSQLATRDFVYARLKVFF